MTPYPFLVALASRVTHKIPRRQQVALTADKWSAKILDPLCADIAHVPREGECWCGAACGGTTQRTAESEGQPLEIRA